MRKLIISLLAVSLLVVIPSAAYTKAEWQAIKDQEAAETEAMNDYQAKKAVYKRAFAAGEYDVALALCLEIVDMDHCQRLTKVRAWYFNNAAYCIILAGWDAPDKERLKKAREYLWEARRIVKAIRRELSNSDLCFDLLEKVEKNIAYCEEHLK